MEPVRTLAAYLLSAALTFSGVGAAGADPALGEGEAIPAVETAATATPAPEATLLPGVQTVTSPTAGDSKAWGGPSTT